MAPTVPRNFPLLALGLSLTLLAGGGCKLPLTGKDQCLSTADCTAGRLCIEQRCRLPGPGGGAPDGSADAGADHPAGEGGALDLAADLAADPDVAPCGPGCTQRCGDGMVQGTEACDDGNDVEDDDCTNRCTRPRCGDGILQAGEECDDGNSRGHDRCTGACRWSPFIDVAIGVGHACAVRRNGSVVCWGRNDVEQAVPPGAELGPPQLLFQAVAVTDTGSCAIRNKGVVCWGSTTGQAGGAPVTQLSAGPTHACALHEGGSISCWGSDTNGKTRAPNGAFTRVSAGSQHTCALNAEGNAVCWGASESGQTDVSGSIQFEDIVASDRQTCTLDLSGHIACWGRASPGVPAEPVEQFSVSTTHGCAVRRADKGLVCWGLGADVPVVIPAPPGKFTRVVTGPSANCAITVEGGLTCWGSNRSGLAVAPTESFQRLSVNGPRACGLRPDGSALCWTDAEEATPMPEGPFRELAAGRQHTCALRLGGAVQCWGGNDKGQTQMPGGLFQQVISGEAFSCALDRGGQATCWGDISAPPAATFSRLAAGPNYACGLLASGQARCWGNVEALLLNPPQGRFDELFLGPAQGLALRRTPERKLARWGRDTAGCEYSDFMDLVGFRKDGTFCFLETFGGLRCCAPTPSARRDSVFDRHDAAFTAIQPGDGFSCVLRKEGGLLCWGARASGLDYREKL